ncbi:MAG TPA: TonB-dependent receptor, partial [Segetibacter sp.]
ERSSGANADINYKTKAGEWSVILNQGFFVTRIKHPLVITNTSIAISYQNASQPLVSSGTESYIQLHRDELELYLGYTFTNTLRKYDPVNKYLPLTARHKFASVIAYEFSEKFRAGIESAFTGTQYLDNGNTTSPYLFAAAMIRYNLGKVSFVLNGENLLDYRLSKQQQTVYPPYNNPVFPEIWAPLEGRVINLSMMIKW